MRQRQWLGLWLSLLIILISGGIVQAQGQTLYWQRYDVNLTVEPNSDILIEEIQQIVFTSGAFRFGFAAIPLDRVEDITDLTVSELINGSERPYTPNSTSEYGFETRINEGDLEITWYFPPTSNSEHTYILRYRIIGGLRIYEGGDQLWWKAIPPDHNFLIQESRVTVTLPKIFPKDQLVVASYGAPATVSYTDRGQVVFEVQNVDSDQELEVRVEFPHSVVQDSPPAWQAADDRQAQWEPVLRVIFGGLGLILLVGGPVAVYLLWHTRGRDVPVGLVAEYITEPPSNLPAGVVGTLVDERAELKDIIAAIVDLARRGALRMEEQQEEGFLGIGARRDFIFHLEDAGQVQRPYEKTLLQRVFGSGKERRMSDLRHKFYTAIPELSSQLYEEVVQEGFFPSNPNTTRTIWLVVSIVGLILSGALAIILLILLGNYSPAVACPGGALAITALSLLFISYSMPRKTQEGAEEAAKWLAFKRYLETIEKHGDLAAVKDKFEEFLPYAVAFGLERSLINKFAAVDAPAPSWWGPVFMPRPGYGYGYPHIGGMGQQPSSGHMGGAPGPLAGEGGQVPTLTGMSESIGTSLASMSAGLGAMLSSASTTLASTPPPQTSGSGGWSGGGFSGGGFSGGGGGGGGSRGFG